MREEIKEIIVESLEDAGVQTGYDTSRIARRILEDLEDAGFIIIER